MCGIYQIRNLVNNKAYIGQTMREFNLRKREHFSYLRHGKHNNIEMQNDWNKYGENNFVFEILEELETPDHTLLDKLETKHIKNLKKKDLSYNVFRGGRCGAYKIGEKNRKYLTGAKASEDTKRKMSNSQRNYWKNISEEKREEFKKAVKNNNVGKTRSPELRKRISETLQKNPTTRKYTDEEIFEVRIRSEILKQKNNIIAKAMNMTTAYVRTLVNYKRWKNLFPTEKQIEQILEKINYTHDNPLPSPKGKV